MGPAELIRDLAAIDTATLHESGAERIMDGSLRPLSGTRRLCGTALTVLAAPGDNLAIHLAVARAAPGDVLVVQCGDAGHGVWGEVLTVAAMARGIAGLVLDGSVRDLAAIRALGFPLFARGTCLRGTRKAARGVVDAPVMCGGALVAPGDLVVGDESGIVLVAPDAAPGVLERAAERQRKEAALMEGLRQGRTTVELMGLE